MFLVMLQGCGEVQFAPGAPKPTAPVEQRSATVAEPVPEPAPVVVVPPAEEPAGLALTMGWQWPCAEGTSTSNGDIVGDGVFELPQDDLASVTLNLNGQVCEPQARERDVVFVIDVSFSNDVNDKYEFGTCGRAEAVKSVIQQYEAINGSGSNIRFAVTTFGSRTHDTNLGFHSTFASMGRELVTVSGSSKVEDVLCAMIDRTNYDAGLSASAALFSRAGRSTATKQVFFISDGMPSDGDGVQIATGMRALGTTIATVMLRGDDAKMKRLASTDSKGNLLHVKVDEAQKIGEALTKLADNRLEGARFRYRIVGSREWTDIDLISSLDDQLRYQLPPLMIDAASLSKGLEVKYEYWDSQNRKVEKTGRLKWKGQKD